MYFESCTRGFSQRLQISIDACSSSEFHNAKQASNDLGPRLRDHLFRKSYETLLHKSLVFGGGAVRHSVELDL